MIPLQLDGLFDGALVGIPLVWVVSIGGLLAFLIGIAARIHREKRRDRMQPSINRLLEGMAESSPSTDGGVTPSEGPAPRPAAAAETDGGAADPEAPIASGDRLDAEPPDPAPPLEAASTQLAAGQHAEAIKTAYAATRPQLAEAFDIEPHGTYWDFYERCEALDRDVDGLDELTELYERALFSQSPIDREDAERAVAIAGALTGATRPDAG